MTIEKYHNIPRKTVVRVPLVRRRVNGCHLFNDCTSGNNRLRLSAPCHSACHLRRVTQISHWWRAGWRSQCSWILQQTVFNTARKLYDIKEFNLLRIQTKSKAIIKSRFFLFNFNATTHVRVAIEAVFPVFTCTTLNGSHRSALSCSAVNGFYNIQWSHFQLFTHTTTVPLSALGFLVVNIKMQLDE